MWCSVLHMNNSQLINSIKKGDRFKYGGETVTSAQPLRTYQRKGGVATYGMMVVRANGRPATIKPSSDIDRVERVA